MENNLIFYVIIALLLWYFFYYSKHKTRPSLKPPSQQPKTVIHSEPGPSVISCPGPIKFPSNQTKPDPSEEELEATLDLLLEDMREFDKELGDFD